MVGSSDSPDLSSPRNPIAAQNLALHAVLSRIFSSIIVEGLALGVYDSVKKRGAILSLDCPPDAFNSSQAIVFPLEKAPQFAKAFEGYAELLRIVDIDPEDIPLQTSPQFYIVEADGTSRSIHDGVEVLRVVQTWSNIHMGGFDTLVLELTDCLTNALAMYLNPPSTPTLQSDYITWEQSLVDGHSTHPMFLIRTPLSSDVGQLPVEQLTTISLHFVLIEAEKTVLIGEYAAEIKLLTDAANIVVPPGFIAFPVHEYQLKYLATTDVYKKIKVLPETCTAKVQSSIRTVTPWDLHSDKPLLPHTAIKLPIAISKTGGLRILPLASITVGIELNSHWPHMTAIDPSILHICRERAGFYFKDDDSDIGKHMSCIVREDPTRYVKPGESVALCAALFQRADGGWGSEMVVVKVWGLDSREKRAMFLESYTNLLFKCFLPPLLVHGFCFEAHGQNALVHYEIATGKLLRFSIRDFQSVGIWQPAMESSTGYRVPLIATNTNDAPNLKDVHAKSFHVMIQTHLHPLIRALDMHSDFSGWKIVRNLLEIHLPGDSALRKDWLETSMARYKCFLRMKIWGLDRPGEHIFKEVSNLLELGRDV